MRVSKEWTFEAAHHLPDHDGLCANPHGHTYTFVLEVEGPVAKEGPKKGMVIDFGILNNIVEESILPLDHTDLNETFFNPTAEVMVEWMVDQVNKFGEQFFDTLGIKITRAELWEGKKSRAIWP